jgi:hypothetical protein
MKSFASSKNTTATAVNGGNLGLSMNDFHEKKKGKKMMPFVKFILHQQFGSLSH